MNNSFGIVITTYIGDFFLTKALLASIEYYSPSTPICIIKDGEFDFSEDIEPYNIVKIIQKEDVENDFLRNNCFGSRCTNMVAFWESPFEHFLYLDSDTIMWGNLPTNSNMEFDFIYNTPHEPYTDEIIIGQYFDFNRIFSVLEKIDLRKHHFFNAGVFFAKKGVFELTLFEKLFFMWKEDKSIFGPEPQGFINYMLFLGVEKNLISAAEFRIQEVFPVCSLDYLKKCYPTKLIVSEQNSPIILHWAGQKPLLSNRKEVFMDPQLHFRKQHLKNIKSLWYYLPYLRFWIEEKITLLERYYSGNIFMYIKSKISRWKLFCISF